MNGGLFFHMKGFHELDKPLCKGVVVNSVHHIIKKKAANQYSQCRDQHRLQQNTEL